MSVHEDRARGLLARMTLKEKVAQLIAVWLSFDDKGGVTVKDLTGFSVNDSHQDVAEVLANGMGQITRPLGTRSIAPRQAVRALNSIQKYLVEKTRLGIPALPHEECLAGVMARDATLFPAGINYGALWDPELMEKVASVIGEQLFSVGARQGLAPVLDVSRDVRWGRTEESLGEDPYLAGCLAVAYVRGLQGGPHRRVLATLKHFVGHSFSEGGRNHAPVHVGERELNDVFMLPFEMAVKLADAGSLMPAYHDIDGEPCTVSRRNCTEILRGQWGFDGIIVSDYEAISLLYDHHKVAADKAEAAALAIRAGMDVELPGATCFFTGIEQAVDRGILDVDDVNGAVLRVLVEKSRLGLFEHPFADEEGIAFNLPAHRTVAIEAAEKSITLLTNDGILPLSAEKTTALIGPLADEPNAGLSGYSFPVHVSSLPQGDASDETHRFTLRETFADRLPGDRLLYARGCDILSRRPRQAPVFPGELSAGHGEQADNVSFDTSGIQEAAAVAARADQVVLVMGDIAGLFLSGTVGEGSDASSLRLPGVQQELLDAVLATGRPLVVILVSGRPYNILQGYARANAVIEAWLPGQEGARVLSDIVFGDREPGGRLPVSIPRSAGAMPYFYNHKLKSAGTPIQKEFGAIFPFGHGMSYTRFAYRDFSVESRTVPADGQVIVGGVIRNVGERRGDEVVQVYVRDIKASLVRPLKELKAFKRVTLGPGQSVEIRFRIPVDMLSYTMTGTDRVVEPGDFEIMVGSSSEDFAYRQTITVGGELRHLPGAWRMQSDVEMRPVH